ncbi:alpha/beta hydrolase [Variovorax sp. PCZ-1]|nr:alpha/beta hydrolase [Variovorax sp. PCZ-1]MBS7806835.1 alpha/beta hydrolase [Variovorax sp. PCZ-1]
MSWRGRKLFYKKAGQGPVLLLIHGYPAGSYDWHAIYKSLGRYFTVIAPDMLGHGFSDKPLDGDYSLNAHAQMHDVLLQYLGITQCQVMASDLGVSVAQEMLALRQANPSLPRMDSLILLNGGVCPDAYQPRMIQRLMLTQLGPWLGPRVTQSMFANTISSIYRGDADAPPASLLEDFWALFCYGQGQAVAHRVGAFWHERKALSERLLGALLNSQIRLCLINGSADPNSGEHMVKAFLRYMPSTDVKRLAGVGHWPQIQASEHVLLKSLQFLQAR